MNLNFYKDDCQAKVVQQSPLFKQFDRKGNFRVEKGDLEKGSYDHSHFKNQMKISFHQKQGKKGKKTLVLNDKKTTKINSKVQQELSTMNKNVIKKSRHKKNVYSLNDNCNLFQYLQNLNAPIKLSLKTKREQTFFPTEDTVPNQEQDHSNSKSLDLMDEPNEEKEVEQSRTLAKEPVGSSSSLLLQRENLICKIKDHLKKFGEIPQTSLDFYKISQFLGEGSYGKVYRGQSVLTNFPVALKCYDKQKIKSNLHSQRIIQEIELLKNLNHQNVIKIFEIFSNKKFVFMVMELVNKGDLLNYLQKHGRFSEFQFLPILKQITEGLYYIHNNHILH